MTGWDVTAPDSILTQSLFRKERVVNLRFGLRLIAAHHLAFTIYLQDGLALKARAHRSFFYLLTAPFLVN
jgi:hypothetical protein